MVRISGGGGGRGRPWMSLRGGDGDYELDLVETFFTDLELD